MQKKAEIKIKIVMNFLLYIYTNLFKDQCNIHVVMQLPIFTPARTFPIETEAHH